MYQLCTSLNKHCMIFLLSQTNEKVLNFLYDSIAQSLNQSILFFIFCFLVLFAFFNLLVVTLN